MEMVWTADGVACKTFGVMMALLSAIMMRVVQISLVAEKRRVTQRACGVILVLVLPARTSFRKSQNSDEVADQGFLPGAFTPGEMEFCLEKTREAS
jgi:hypothetical protein